MYSGTTLTKMSGRILGGHQKIDRISRKHLGKLISSPKLFPSSASILHFEGKNGPDAIKRKSPALDEPWHYYSPFNDDDSLLIDLIKQHYDNLVKELKNRNTERVSFEAAWLAHALVDGLTPAHHYPYEEKLSELRGGEGLESRTTIKDKLVMPGDNKRQQVKNNWKMWGPRGLFTTHGLFEMGVSTLLLPLSLSDAQPSTHDLSEVLDIGITEKFKRFAKEIAVLDMYDAYYRKGWTPKFAYDVRNKLGPTLVKMVTLAWYSAMYEAGLIKK